MLQAWYVETHGEDDCQATITFGQQAICRLLEEYDRELKAKKPLI